MNIPCGLRAYQIPFVFETPRQAMEISASAYQDLPYFALPIMALTLLRWASPWLLLVMLLVVWVGDTFAYYLGTRWGRHKLAPVVSPGKTWEGAVASLVGSAAAAWLVLTGLEAPSAGPVAQDASSTRTVKLIAASVLVTPSLTRTVNGYTPGPCVSLGVHVNTPVAASMAKAPVGSPAVIA